jgi:hypothetical protein
MQHVSLDMIRLQSLAQELQPCLSGKGIQWDEEGWHYRFFIACQAMPVHLLPFSFARSLNSALQRLQRRAAASRDSACRHAQLLLLALQRLGI